MTETTDTTTDAPSITKVQYNIPGTEHSFEGKTDVDQEYYEHINHDDWAVRIVLDNGNWVELRKIDDTTMEECVFIQEQHPDGQYEAFLHDSTTIPAVYAAERHEFYNAVDTNLAVYQSEIGTIADAEVTWSTIVPALKR